MENPHKICGTLCSVSRLWRDQFLKIYKSEFPAWKENASVYLFGPKRGRDDDFDYNSDDSYQSFSSGPFHNRHRSGS